MSAVLPFDGGPSTERAGGLVEARLGRTPQDALEAAVVLEAWGGVPAPQALRAGRRLLAASAPVRVPSAGAPPREAGRPGLLETLALLVAVLAVAGWSAPLGEALGAAGARTAIALALPLSLALAWGLGSRGAGQPGARALLAGALVLVAAPWALLGAPGAVAGLLCVVWAGGTLLVRRGWAPASLALVGAGTGALTAGLAAVAVVGALAALTALALALALRGRVPAHPAAGRGPRALVAAATGGGLGALLVADPSAAWTAGALPALGLVPSTLAGAWAGAHLWRVHVALPGALSGVAVRGAAASAGRRGASAVLLGAVVRLVVLAAALSGALVALAGPQVGGAGVLGGFALVALLTLLAGFLAAAGRPGWAAGSVAAALAAQGAVALLEEAPFAGAGLVAGAGAGALVALPAALALLRAPAATLATRLWIT